MVYITNSFVNSIFIIEIFFFISLPNTFVSNPILFISPMQPVTVMVSLTPVSLTLNFTALPVTEVAVLVAVTTQLESTARSVR